MTLEAAGIKTIKEATSRGNEFLETSAKDVYVLGDVKGPPAFTHISYDDFRIIKNKRPSVLQPPPTNCPPSTVSSRT